MEITWPLILRIHWWSSHGCGYLFKSFSHKGQRLFYFYLFLIQYMYFFTVNWEKWVFEVKLGDQILGLAVKVARSAWRCVRWWFNCINCYKYSWSPHAFHTHVMLRPRYLCLTIEPRWLSLHHCILSGGWWHLSRLCSRTKSKWSYSWTFSQWNSGRYASSSVVCILTNICSCLTN